MSFYGNSYFYTADTFAKVVLENLGILKTDIPDQPDPNTSVSLESHKKDAGLGISSGNRWIVLQQTPGVDQGFKIWHNAPRSTGDDLNMVVPGAQDVNPDTSDEVQKTDSKYVENAIHLGFGDCIKIPTFYYDETGHVSKKNEMVYFQLPENPMDDATDRMDDIEARMNLIDGADSEPSGGSLKTKLEKALSDYTEASGKIGEANTAAANAEAAAASAQTSAQNAETQAQNAALQAQNAADTAMSLGSTIGGILTRISTLEAKIK